MARTAPGRFVIRGDDDNRYPVEGDLANALGCVSAARFIEDRVEVQVRWFGQAKPEGYLTPSGFASFVTCPQGYDAVGKGYRLESFALNSHSAFERATKV
jgi:hypothetical protein